MKARRKLSDRILRASLCTLVSGTPAGAHAAACSIKQVDTQVFIFTNHNDTEVRLRFKDHPNSKASEKIGEIPLKSYTQDTYKELVSLQRGGMAPLRNSFEEALRAINRNAKNRNFWMGVEFPESASWDSGTVQSIRNDELAWLKENSPFKGNEQAIKDILLLQYGAIYAAAVYQGGVPPKLQGIDTGRKDSFEFNASDEGMARRNSAAAVEIVKLASSGPGPGFVEFGTDHSQGLRDDILRECIQAQDRGK